MKTVHVSLSVFHFRIKQFYYLQSSNCLLCLYIFPFTLRFTDSFQKRMLKRTLSKDHLFRHIGRFPESATGIKKSLRSERAFMPIISY